jgi:hypothetical protein
MPYKNPEDARKNRQRRKLSGASAESDRRWRKAHPEKHKAVYKNWAKKNHERLLAYKRAWYKKTKPVRKHTLRAWRLARIDAKATHPRPLNCEACGIPVAQLEKALCFDHVHATGVFRGWLCSPCNLALGLVNDSRDRLQLLMNYLDCHELRQ